MIKHYRDLLSDATRINQFRAAISQLIKPDSVVVEIGSALGTYAFFCAQAGAKRIYAIEMSDIFFVGKELARLNQLADKITFIHGKSTEIDLPERADFIIMEDYSPFFLYAGLEQVICDAQRRFLKPDGTFIPAQIILKYALVEYPAFHQQLDCWVKKNDRLYGLDWSYTTELTFNQTYFADESPKRLLTDAITIKSIDLAHDANFTFNSLTKIKITNSGTVHGIIGWWDCFFTSQQFFSNAPNSSENTWGQLFFPLRYPITVQTGDEVEINLMALESLRSQTIDYKWVVNHQYAEQEGNTFRGTYLDLKRLTRFTQDAELQLNKKGKIVSFLLSKCTQPINWQNLARELSRGFPAEFPDEVSALQVLPTLLKDFIR